jgi:prepilin-type N-terminal cleavage/methylation domain-containing protein
MRATATSKSRRPGRSVTVAWHDRAWRPRIAVQCPASSGRYPAATKRAVIESPPHFPNCNPVFSKPMKTITIKCGQWPAFAGLRHGRQVASDQNRRSARNETPVTRHLSRLPRRSEAKAGVTSRAFTIVELLTVIAIIAILAAMLLPALSAAKVHAQKTQARLQIDGIVTAIQNYDSAYSRFPVSTNVQTLVGNNPAFGGQFTFGGSVFTNAVPTISVSYLTNNSEVIAILMDITNTSVTAVNANHQKNPQQTVFLNAKTVSDPNLPGVGPDLVYRDPWRNPYVITMNLNADNQTKDAFYGQSAVSGPGGASTNPGLNGLVNPDGMLDNFRYHGNVMVWSAGPDKKIDPTVPANQGVNNDNVLSW